MKPSVARGNAKPKPKPKPQPKPPLGTFASGVAGRPGPAGTGTGTAPLAYRGGTFSSSADSAAAAASSSQAAGSPTPPTHSTAAARVKALAALDPVFYHASACQGNRHADSGSASLAANIDELLLSELCHKADKLVVADPGHTRLHTLVDTDGISITEQSAGGRKAISAYTHHSYSDVHLTEILVELSAHPASAATANSHGEYPLHIAASQQFPSAQVIRELLSVFIGAAAASNENGNLPLHLLCLRTMGDDLEPLKALIEGYPGAVNAENNPRKHSPMLPVEIAQKRKLQYPKLFQYLVSRSARGEEICNRSRQEVVGGAVNTYFWIKKYIGGDYSNFRAVRSAYNAQLNLTISRYPRFPVLLSTVSMSESPNMSEQLSSMLSFVQNHRCAVAEENSPVSLARAHLRTLYVLLSLKAKLSSYPFGPPPVECLENSDFPNPSGDLLIFAVSGLVEAALLAQVLCNPEVIVVFDKVGRRQVWVKRLDLSGGRIADARRTTFRYSSAARLHPAPCFRAEAPVVLNDIEEAALRNLRWLFRSDAFLVAARYKDGAYFPVLSEIAHWL